MTAAGQPAKGKHALTTKTIDELAGHPEHTSRLGRRDLLRRTEDDNRFPAGNVLEHQPERVPQIRAVVYLCGELTSDRPLRPVLGGEGGQG